MTIATEQHSLFRSRQHLIPDSIPCMQDREGYPPEWLVERASNYWVGVRSMAFDESAQLTRPYPELSQEDQLRYILDHESIGSLNGLDDETFWQAAYVKYPYGSKHFMAVPGTTNPFVSDLQCDEGKPEEWNNKLYSLFSYGSSVFEKQDQENASETFIGINSGRNQTRPFLHVHFVDLLQNEWKQISYRQISAEIQHREDLLKKNTGFNEAVRSATFDLTHRYPDIVRPSWFMTNGGSVYMELSKPAGQIAQDREFIKFLRDTDMHMHTAQIEAGVPEDQQCQAMVLGQTRENKPYFAFQLAAKMGKSPSGVLEAINYAFFDPVNYRSMTSRGTDIKFKTRYLTNTENLYQNTLG